MLAADYQDDPALPDTAVLWRRVHPKWIVADESPRGYRLSTAAFDDDPEGGPTSVILADDIIAAGGSPANALLRHPEHALVSITAGDARKAGQKVAREPLADQPSHAVIVGNKTYSVKRSLARAARWVFVPPEILARFHRIGE
ncbi:MAG: hypothetical protein HYY16_02370 [Planctomycetes bacterium]|nr:hypothetical protein [Planctomycetota bacterium]